MPRIIFSFPCFDIPFFPLTPPPLLFPLFPIFLLICPCSPLKAITLCSHVSCRFCRVLLLDLLRHVGAGSIYRLPALRYSIFVPGYDTGFFFVCTEFKQFFWSPWHPASPFLSRSHPKPATFFLGPFASPGHRMLFIVPKIKRKEKKRKCFIKAYKKSSGKCLSFLSWHLLLFAFFLILGFFNPEYKYVYCSLFRVTAFFSFFFLTVICVFLR